MSLLRHISLLILRSSCYYILFHCIPFFLCIFYCYNRTSLLFCSCCLSTISKLKCFHVVLILLYYGFYLCCYSDYYVVLVGVFLCCFCCCCCSFYGQSCRYFYCYVCDAVIHYFRRMFSTSRQQTQETYTRSNYDMITRTLTPRGLLIALRYGTLRQTRFIHSSLRDGYQRRKKTRRLNGLFTSRDMR